MDRVCSRFGARLLVCCQPSRLVEDSTPGCIDGALINRLLKAKGARWRVTETLHNRIGRQRPNCMCTYSIDVGHTPGVASCFDTDAACLYCYSQRNASGRAIEKAKKLLGVQ